MTESIYIPRGVNVYSLSRETQWYFEPRKEFRVGRGMGEVEGHVGGGGGVSG